VQEGSFFKSLQKNINDIKTITFSNLINKVSVYTKLALDEDLLMRFHKIMGEFPDIQAHFSKLLINIRLEWVMDQIQDYFKDQISDEIQQTDLRQYFTYLTESILPHLVFNFSKSSLNN